MKRLLRSGIIALVAASCSGTIPDADRRDRSMNGVANVFVTITQGERGTLERPLPYETNGRTVTLRVEARGADNMPRAGFNGWVTLSLTPGTLQAIEPGAGYQVAGRSLQLTDGVAENVRVRFSRAYGEVRMWAEEAGYEPVAIDGTERPLCANGMDDDGDGLADFPADTGCAAPNDNTERGGSYAVGSSEPLYFQTPIIDDVMGTSQNSPLVNERISITRGELVVTRISTSGFWVTDIANRMCPDPANPMMMRRCSSSIFAFNFRLPEGMRPCDRLSILQGTVQTFVGTTQLAQPAWRITEAGLWIDEAMSGECRIPAADAITTNMLMDSQTAFRPFVNGLVRIEGVDLSRNIGPGFAECSMDGAMCTFGPGRSNCDFNSDGIIDFDNAREGGCSNRCQRERSCSEWTNWSRFGQLAVDFRTGQPADIQRLIIAPRFALSDFDPLRPPAVTRTAGAVVTGTLKSVGPNWIIEPRCTQDLVLAGEPLPTNHSCIFPRTITEE